MEEFGYSLVRPLYTNPQTGVEVFEAIDIRTHTFVVLKKVDSFDILQINKLLDEVLAQKSLDSHPNICKVLKVGFSRTGLFIVLEKLESDLSKVIKSRGSLFPESEIWGFLREMVDALAFAQRTVSSIQGITHRDIKPQNILVDENGKFKLCDFGCAKELSASEESEHTFQGTPLFLSPQLREELAKRTHAHSQKKVFYSPYKSDVYSLGLTVLYMCRLQPPVALATLPNLNENTYQLLSELPYSIDLKQVLNWMLSEGESARPDFLQLQEWLTKGMASVPTRPREPQPESTQKPLQIAGASNLDQPTLDSGRLSLAPTQFAVSPLTAAIDVPAKCTKCHGDIVSKYFRTPCGHFCCSEMCSRALLRKGVCDVCRVCTSRACGYYVMKTPCPYDDCHKILSSKFNLQRHIDTCHLRIKRFECEVCFKRFASKQNLREHEFIHEEEELPANVVPMLGLSDRMEVPKLTDLVKFSSDLSLKPYLHVTRIYPYPVVNEPTLLPPIKESNVQASTMRAASL